MVFTVVILGVVLLRVVGTVVLLGVVVWRWVVDLTVPEMKWIL